MNKIKTIPWSNKITSIQCNVLEALAKVKFMTLSQMLDFGVGTTQYKYLWKQVASLRDRKRSLIDRRSFNTAERLGRVEDLYFLTKRGRQVLIYDLQVPEEEIRMPIGKIIAYKDYHHRKSTIDFQIKLLQWAKANTFQIPLFSAYYDKIGDNRSGKNLTTLTKIEFEGDQFFIPDALFLLQSTERERLFLFEMHNGHDTLRLLKQLHKHAHALVGRYTHRKLNYDSQKSYSIILLFEHTSTKQAFIKRLIKKGAAFRDIQQFFLCKSMEEMNQGDFDLGWQTIFGEEKNLI